MIKYNPKFNLKYKFPGLNVIQQNYSQTFQDMFVLTMLNGKRNGTFLEIGAQDPIEISNTYLLESVFGWHGISIEIDNKFSELHKKYRTNTFVCDDALKLDYTKILANYSRQIDYLQVDIDNSAYDCLMDLPLVDYRFSVITFEHDAYRTAQGSYTRQASRSLLRKYGYTLIAGNISNISHDDVYEDWWVDPKVVDSKLIEMFCGGENACIPGDELLTI